MENIKNTLKSIEVYRKVTGNSKMPEKITIKLEKSLKQFDYCFVNQLKPLCWLVSISSFDSTQLDLLDNYGVKVAKHYNNGRIADIEIQIHLDEIDYNTFFINYTSNSKKQQFNLNDIFNNMKVSAMTTTVIDLNGEIGYNLNIYSNIKDFIAKPVYKRDESIKYISLYINLQK